MPCTGYQHMVHDYYIKRLHATYTERRATLRALRTRAQAQQYQEEIRRAIARARAQNTPQTPWGHVPGTRGVCELSPWVRARARDDG